MDNAPMGSRTGNGLGIAGFILGVVALPLALLGCTSLFALVLSILGTAFSTVALTQARKISAPSTIILSGLIVSVIALSFSLLKFTNTVDKVKNFPWSVVNNKIEQIEEESEELGRAFEEEFEDELGGNLEDVLRELEEELKELEGEVQEVVDESINEVTDKEEAARKLGRAAGKAVKEFVDELDDSSGIHIHIETE